MSKHKHERRDHVARLVAQRRAVTPDIPLDGMEILGRARRLTLLSRPPIEGVLARRGVDAGEFDVLATLRRSNADAVRPTELYQALMISSGGLTDRLRRLESAGLIERVACAQDKRSMLVRLTDKGQSIIDLAFAEDMAVELELLAALDPAERETLADLLSKLLMSLETGA
ncbi:MarR family winged helix-turn-helix transcriptional regulator [Qipengyuania sp. ASV99]|uniref:MarR family winged helix-turn-helix transcriptional regulator n=1 Tax=Qipengyuania sp. ASV99 TaxID=3399681 RepID=UPI003A4C5F4F